VLVRQDFTTKVKKIENDSRTGVDKADIECILRASRIKMKMEANTRNLPTDA
jgi:hypothetical protein